MGVGHKGYLTQCDSGDMLSPYTNTDYVCQAVTRLSKPARWRCPKCEGVWGPIREVPLDLP